MAVIRWNVDDTTRLVSFGKDPEKAKPGQSDGYEEPKRCTWCGSWMVRAERVCRVCGEAQSEKGHD